MAGVMGLVAGVILAIVAGVLIPRMDDVIGFVRGKLAAPLIGWIAATIARWAHHLKSTGWA